MDKEKVISYLRDELEKFSDKAFQTKSNEDAQKYMALSNAVLVINQIL